MHKTGDASTPRRSLRKRDTKEEGENELPDVVREMLHEERVAKRLGEHEDNKPLKKRKTEQTQMTSSSASHSQTTESVTKPEVATTHTPKSTSQPTPRLPHTLLPYEPELGHNASSHQPSRILQTIEDSEESEDDSDMEWEDALGDGGDSEDNGDAKVGPEIGDVSITIGGKKSEEVSTKKKVRRRAITSVDRKKRLDIHKMHVLCLLYHIHRRNAWCNDARVQSALCKLVEPKILTNLVPNPDLTQYSASKRFIDALNDLKIMWSKRFKVTAQGMSKPKWAESGAEVRPSSDFDELDSPMDKDDFRAAARTLQGSSDVGGQLFCALLRGIGIETRLVCSLQELPFASAAQPSTPHKPSQVPKIIVMDPYNKSSGNSPASARNKKLSRLERIMGERHPVLNKAGTGPKKLKAFHTPYPVYWVEAFNSAHQRWVPIDPLSTFTINSPEKLEPPFSYAQNTLTYAVAFEDIYTVRDVTRRYARAYNAKTLKFRVESTSHGSEWWMRALRLFTRHTPLPRDETEDAMLARKVAAEGIPKNMQDFKNHPAYVLERHLKHNEVIYPLDVVGKVNVGSSMNPRMEHIYRRKNVQVVRSADKWYRMGRDVKHGEQPLKHAKPKKGRLPSIGPDEDIEDHKDEIGTALYAEFQTDLYIPPPVVRGKVPRNVYGNLDLYVPSMCPPGGVHIRHKLASKAARILHIDFADAVTGFSFKGRHGTAIIQGCVVAAEFADAVNAIIEGMEYMQEQAELDARRAESLRLWRRFYLGLCIAQRVNAIEIDGQKGDVVDVQASINHEEQRRQAREMAGGFLSEGAAFIEPSRPLKADVDVGRGFVLHEEQEDRSRDDADCGSISSNSDGSNFKLGGSSLNRQESFGSVILERQELCPRRSSLGELYVSSDASPPCRDVSPDEEAEESEWEDPSGFENLHERTQSPVPGPPRHNGLKLPERVAAQRDRDADTNGTFVVPTVTDTSTAMHDALAPSESQLERAAVIPNEETVQPEAKFTLEDAEDEAIPTSSLSDTGSLLLEDPDDEDADPDWLVDLT